MSIAMSYQVISSRTRHYIFIVDLHATLWQIYIYLYGTRELAIPYEMGHIKKSRGIVVGL
jgi:hypothetical protein